MAYFQHQRQVLNDTRRSAIMVDAGQLNNKATEFIQRSDYNQALHILSHAMNSLKQLNGNTSNSNHYQTYQHRPTSMHCSSPIIDGFLPSLEFVAPSISSQARSKSPSSSTVASHKQQFSSWFLHEDSVKVNLTKSLLDSNRKATTSLLTYAVVYNVALCHHLEATTSPSYYDNTIQLERAALLYRYAQQQLHQYNHIGNEEMDVSNNHEEDIMIYSLAIANNLTHVYRCLQNYDAANKCFQRLLNAMMYLTLDSTDVIFRTSHTDDEDSGIEMNYHQYVMNKHAFCIKNVFLSNVMSMLTPRSSFPAPAA